MTIDELIVALERAEGPNLTLDRAIADLVDPDIERHGIRLEQRKFGDDGNFNWSGVVRDLCPNFTRSIDAALSLVPDGFTVHTIHHGMKQWDVSLCIVGDCGLASWDAGSDSLAIALCIAALRARKGAA